MIRKLLLIVILIFLPTLTFSQSIWRNDINGTNPNNSNPYTTGQTFDSNISVSGISRGSGIGSSNGNNVYNANGWTTNNSVDSNDYFEFSLTPNSGYKIDFTSFTYTGSITNGPRNFALRSSKDNYATDIQTSTTLGSTFNLGSTFQNISSTITFRLYGYRSSSSTNTFSVNDFIFNGTVSCITAPTTTDVTICQGDSGSLTASFSSGTTVTSNTFSGSWNAATDPTARIITTSMNNSQTCGFGTAVRNYTAINFTVNVTGNYTFKMTDTNDYDGMAYIYTGTFTPGTCSAGWMIGDDDSSGSQAEPRMTRNLTAGVVYTLISTTFSASSGTYSGDYKWTITPPAGGLATLATVGWYTDPTSGTLIGAGSPFNPVGVSGLPDTNTPGIYTYYASSGGASCIRTPAVFTINAKPSINVMTNTTCSGAGFTSTPIEGTNGTVPASTTYSWPAPTVTGGMTGGVSGSGASSISGTLNNYSSSDQTATYTVTPVTGSCTGDTFTLTVTVKPSEINNKITFTNGASAQVCGTEVNEGGTTTLTAPAGTYFNTVSFASYGLPNGTCGSYTIGTTCHSPVSQSVSESLLLGNSTASINATNGTFSDACVGTGKRLRISAYYSQPVCSGSIPGVINGTPITGGVYLWEVSTTSATAGFANAGGTNNGQNYTPTTAISNNTWFRRKVTINGCTNISAVLLIKVNPLPTISTAATATTICTGTTSASLAYTATTDAPTTYSIAWNSTPTNTFGAVNNATLTSSPISISIPASAAAGTYTGTITVKNTNGCVSTDKTFTVTINQSPSGLSYTNSSVTYCYNVGITTNNTSLTTTGTPAPVYTVSPALPVGLSLNSATGAITGIPTATIAATNYTVTATNSCGTASAVVNITVNRSPAGLSYSNTSPIYCIGTPITANNPTLTTIGTPASAFSISPALPVGLSINSATGAISGTPTTTIASTNYTITATNTCGNTTSVVNITVNATPTITTHPQTITICEGKNHSFTVVTSAGSPTYQWQYSLDGVSSWTNTDALTGTSGHTSASLNLTNVQLSYSGYYVRCVITAGGCPNISNIASLTVNPTPATPTATVTTQPTCANNTGTITITNPAPATGITYSINGSTYTNTDGIFSGLAPTTYNITVKNSSSCISSAASVTINTATSKQWNGLVDTSWSNPANWTPNGVPDQTDCVVIPVTGKQPIIDGVAPNFYAHTVSINSGGVLTVNSNKTLNLTNEVTVNPGGSLIFNNNSSLMQSNKNAVNSGNITYIRETSVRRYDYTYWSSPLTLASNFTLHSMSPNTLADKYTSYDATGGSWAIHYGGGKKMIPGEGYSVRGPQNFDIVTPGIQTASFIGVPNNGDVPTTTVKDKFNLLGNPYPSAISTTQLITDTNIGTIYFWTHNTPPSNGGSGNKYKYASADYASINLSGPLASGGDPTGPTGFIAAGQGFFAAPTTNSITFTNSMRVGGSNDNFYKTAKTDGLERNRIWLNFTNAEGAFKQMLVGYIEGASNSWDQNYDAVGFNGNSYVDFYSINESTPLSIQGRALPFENSDVIPLGYKTTIAGDFKISIDHVDGLFNSQEVYLEDKKTGVIYDLKAGDYNFKTEIGTFKDRFTLRYTNKTLGTGDFENVKDRLLVSVKDKVIKVTSSKENIKDVTVFDITGKLIYNKKKVGSTELSISNLQAADQVLLVKVTLENDAEVTRKVIFK